MENFITDLKIDNFKSIKHIEMKPKRINVFVGKPNVGKSNILEAISLLGAGYDFASPHVQPPLAKKFMEDFIRYENFYNLFFDNDKQNTISISSGLVNAKIFYQNNVNCYYFLLEDNNYGSLEDVIDLRNKNAHQIGNDFIERINDWPGDKGKFTPLLRFILSSGYIGDIYPDILSPIQYPVKRYEFNKNTKTTDRFHLFLKPPYGENLLTILATHSDVRKEVIKLFGEYNLKLRINEYDNTFGLTRDKGDGFFNDFSYSLQAETLQRYIFHLAAIESNKDSVLLFEEPEAHNFPPYTVQLADKIINSSENQFFITTHSPYMLTELLEESDKEEIALFIVKYENNQTVLKKVSGDEISEILNYGADIFINHKAFE